MPTYVYETIHEDSSKEPVRYEIKQSITEDALTEHPETGHPIRRVITGGIFISPKGKCCSSTSKSCCG